MGAVVFPVASKGWGVVDVCLPTSYQLPMPVSIVSYDHCASGGE